ncbi:MAG TPA: 5-formyltetrahydrofolate cyclo-ligase [Longimicrobium sp.]
MVSKASAEHLCSRSSTGSWAPRNAHVVFPRVLPDSRALDLHTVAEPSSLRIGAYGIREPDPERCARVPVEAVDAVLVPGLAWDRRGARLGRGAGYYDRLFALPEWRGFRCGVFFSAQEFPALPTDPWDVPLQAVVTERVSWRSDRRTSHCQVVAEQLALCLQTHYPCHTLTEELTWVLRRC